MNYSNSNRVKSQLSEPARFQCRRTMFKDKGQCMTMLMHGWNTSRDSAMKVGFSRKQVWCLGFKIVFYMFRIWLQTCENLDTSEEQKHLFWSVSILTTYSIMLHCSTCHHIVWGCLHATWQFCSLADQLRPNFWWLSHSCACIHMVPWCPMLDI